MVVNINDFSVLFWMILNYCFSNIKAADVLPSSYIGCYLHVRYSLGEALTYRLYSSYSNNGDDCKHNCSMKHYILAGTKGDGYFCGNVVQTWHTSGCYSPCPGMADEICGGLFAISVYSTREQSFPTLPSAIVRETSTIDRLINKPTKLFKQIFPQDQAGQAHRSMEGVHIGVTVACIVVILSIVAVFVLLRRHRRQKQAKQKIVYQGGQARTRRSVSVLAATNVAYDGDTSTDDHEHVNMQSNIECSEFSTGYEYSVCNIEREPDDVNYESISASKEHVYGHIKHKNLQFADKTYSHLLIEGKSMKTADQYCHARATANVYHISEEDVSYNHLQVFTNNGVVEMFDDYDVSHACGPDVEKEQSMEYSKLNY